MKGYNYSFVRLHVQAVSIVPVLWPGQRKDQSCLRKYLSSTYNDLKAYRLAVYQTLHWMRQRVFAMEDYVAVDERPIEKCLADVADSYVERLLEVGVNISMSTSGQPTENMFAESFIKTLKWKEV